MKLADSKNLKKGIREAGVYLRGDKRAAARVDRIDPESVIVTRAKLRLSQKEFSSAFGISKATLRNWEQGRRHLTGAARVLLRVDAKHPKAVLEAVGRSRLVCFGRILAHPRHRLPKIPPHAKRMGPSG